MSTQPSSIAASVAAQAGAKAPKGISGFNTRELDISFFHGMLYGETDSMKTTTAANFGGPDRTLILLTRSKEQMIPLRDQGFRVVLVDDGQALAWALQFPEKAAAAIGWPEWAEVENRVLMVDDMTEGSNMLVDDNSTRDDGSDVKDGRQIYKAVNDDLRAIMTGLKRRKMHTIFTALAKVAPSQIANEETVFPDMPTGARAIITADLEFVFFMKRATKKMLTTSDYLTFVKKDEKTGKPVAGKRDIFGKQKLPREMVGRTPPVISKEEPMDLAAVWAKICSAKGIAK